MAQTHAGAMKVRATATGLSLEGYLARCLTEKWCTSCKDWHTLSKFGADASRFDGFTASCRESRYTGHPRGWHGRLPINPKTGRPGPEKGTLSQATRRQMSVSAKAHPSNRLGKRLTVEQRARLSTAIRAVAARGAAVASYRDGKSTERRGLRFSMAYKRWRFDVFEQDDFTCQMCWDARGGNLVAHHLLPFSHYPYARHDLNNGITLCRDCHHAWHYTGFSDNELAARREGRTDPWLRSPR